MRGRCAAALAASTLLLAAGCGSGSPSGRDGAPAFDAQPLGAADVMLRKPIADPNYDAMARAVQDLGYQLAIGVDDGDGNTVVSPLSLALVIAMAREGAGEDAAAGLDQVFGFDDDSHTAYNAAVHDLEDVGAGDELNIGEAAFVDDDYAPKIKASYLDAIKRWYGSDVFETDFPLDAVGDINGWVNQNTEGRIPKLLDGLDPTAKFALVNTVYLNAKWQHPFAADGIDESSFTTHEGDRLQVEWMTDRWRVEYAHVDGAKAVRLPYRGGELAMWLLLPAKGGDPADLLTADALALMQKSAITHQVQVGVPLWDTSTDGALGDLLIRLGMSTSFEPGAFNGITDDPRFRLSDVVQQANITVTEKGTEGAAASAAIFIEGGGGGRPAFTADRPFAFVLLHEPTGLPVLEGVVVDPSQPAG